MSVRDHILLMESILERERKQREMEEEIHRQRTNAILRSQGITMEEIKRGAMETEELSG